MASLPVGAGIQAIPSSQIPNQWSAAWFANFINTWLANGDYRNANQAIGPAQINFTTLAAAPTGKVGLAETSGTAESFMRSDSAPELDVSINPTWTGNHTFSGTTQINGHVGFGKTPIGVVTVTGSKGGNVALANLITALANYGLIVDSTT